MGFDWLARVVASTVVRRLTLLVLAALLAWVGMGKAHAQTHSTRSAAYAYTQGTRSAAQTFCQNSWAQYSPALVDWAIEEYTSNATLAFIRGKYACQTSLGRIPASGYSHIGEASYPKDQQCPPPTKHDIATGQCVDPAARCLAKNDDAPPTNVIAFSGQPCIDGCSYGGLAGSGNTNGAITFGAMGFTGETCVNNTPNPPPLDNEEVCTPAGAGMTMCVKDDGRHCYSGEIQTATEVCWQPGETGTKTDQNVVMTRGPGNTPAPAPTPPGGDTLTPQAGPTTTTTNIDSRTINTTTNTYTTGSGANAGPTNQGTPKGPGPAPGDDDKGETAGGGAGCDQPPTCSSAGSIGCATLQMVWRNRCSEGKNKITGGGECDANGNPLFVCTGDQIMCKQAELQAQAYCLAKKGDGNGDGQPDWTQGDGPGTPGSDGEGDGETSVRTVSVGEGLLDTENIFGAASCPTLSVTIYGQQMTSASIPEWCTIVAIMKAVVLMMGAYSALQILMGRN